MSTNFQSPSSSDDLDALLTGAAKKPSVPRQDRYTIDDLQQAAREAGWPEDEIPKASAIAWHEGAQGNPRANRRASAAENARLTGGKGYPEDSVGAWQINWAAHGPRLQQQGIKREDLFDPVTNARVAYELRQGKGGWDNWKLANRRFHQQYLPLAQEAYKRTGDPLGRLLTTPLATARGSDTTPLDELLTTPPKPNGQEPQTSDVPPVPPEYVQSMLDTAPLQLDKNGRVSIPEMPGVKVRPEQARQFGHVIAGDTPEPAPGLPPDRVPEQMGSSFYGLETPGVMDRVRYEEEAKAAVDRAYGPGFWEQSAQMPAAERAKFVENAQKLNMVSGVQQLQSELENDRLVQQARERQAKRTAARRQAEARRAMARASQVAGTVVQDSDTGHWYFDDPKTKERVYRAGREELNQEMRRRGYGVKIPAPKPGTVQAVAEQTGRTPLQAASTMSQPTLADVKRAEEFKPSSVGELQVINEAQNRARAELATSIRTQLLRNYANPAAMSNADRAQLEGEVQQRTDDAERSIQFTRELNTLSPQDQQDVQRLAQRFSNESGLYRWLDVGLENMAQTIPSMAVGTLRVIGDVIGSDRVRETALVMGKEINKRELAAGAAKAKMAGPEYAAQWTADLAGSIFQIAALSAVPGVGPTKAMAAMGGLGELGRTGSYGRGVVGGAKGAAYGGLFKAVAGFEPFKNNPQLIEKIANLGTDVAVVGSGTYTIERATGATHEEALNAALTNAGAVGVMRLTRILPDAASAAARVTVETKITPEWLRTRVAEPGGYQHVVLREVRPLEGEQALTRPGEPLTQEPTGRALSAYRDPSVPEQHRVAGTEIDAAKAESYEARGIRVIDVTPEQYNAALRSVNSINPTEPAQISAPPPARPEITETASPTSRPPLPRSVEEMTAPERAQEARAAAEARQQQAVSAAADPKQDALNALNRASQSGDTTAVHQLTQMAIDRGATEAEIENVLTLPAETPTIAPRPETPRVPESETALAAQVMAMMEDRGNRKAVIITDAPPLPDMSQIPNIGQVRGPNGEQVIFRSDKVTPAQVLDLMNSGRANELTGLPNAETPQATVAAVVKGADGRERWAAYLEPSNIEAFKKEAEAQFGQDYGPLTFEFGGQETEAQILEARKAESAAETGIPGKTETLTAAPEPPSVVGVGKAKALLETVDKSLIQGRRFHGSPKAFEEFQVPEYKNDPSGVSAIWLSSDPEFASKYATRESMSGNRIEERVSSDQVKPNVRAVYVVAKKIFDVNSQIVDTDLEKILQSHRATPRPSGKTGKQWDETEERLSYWLRNQPKGGSVPGEYVLNALRSSDTAHIRRILEGAGYDAFKPDRGSQASRWRNEHEIAVFNPRQIIPAAEVELARRAPSPPLVEAAAAPQPPEAAAPPVPLEPEVYPPAPERPADWITRPLAEQKRILTQQANELNEQIAQTKYGKPYGELTQPERADVVRTKFRMSVAEQSGMTEREKSARAGIPPADLSTAPPAAEGGQKPEVPPTSTLATAETVQDKSGKPVGIIRNADEVAEGAKPDIRPLHPSDVLPRDEAGRFESPEAPTEEVTREVPEKAAQVAKTATKATVKQAPPVSAAEKTKPKSVSPEKAKQVPARAVPVERLKTWSDARVGDIVEHEGEYVEVAGRGLRETKAKQVAERAGGQVIAEPGKKTFAVVKETEYAAPEEHPLDQIQKVLDEAGQIKGNTFNVDKTKSPAELRKISDRARELWEQYYGEENNYGKDLPERDPSRIAMALTALPRRINAYEDDLDLGKPAFKFSSTQVQITGKAAELMRAAQKKIDPADLQPSAMGGDAEATGLEDDLHVTVKYGVHSESPKGVQKALQGEGPITAKFGKVDVFEGVEDGTADAVIVKIESPDLHRLNKQIADNVEVTDTYPEYKPHATLAYVKLGAGKKYRGMDLGLEGHELSFETVVFSAKDKTTTQIPLGGKDDAVETGQIAVSDQLEHPRAAQRKDVRPDEGEVRKEKGRQASRGDRVEPVAPEAEVASAPKPSEVALASKIKASKAAGNEHLDTAPWGVEYLRGKRIRSLRDESSGVILTVTSERDANVEWDDQRSAEANSATLETIQIGKHTERRWQSAISAVERQEWVVDPGARIAIARSGKGENADLYVKGGTDAERKRREPSPERGTELPAKAEEGKAEPAGRVQTPQAGVAQEVFQRALNALKEVAPGLAPKVHEKHAKAIAKMIESGKPDEKVLKIGKNRQVYESLLSPAGEPAIKPAASAEPEAATTPQRTGTASRTRALDWVKRIRALPANPAIDELQELYDEGQKLDLKTAIYQRILERLESAIAQTTPSTETLEDLSDIFDQELAAVSQPEVKPVAPKKPKAKAKAKPVVQKPDREGGRVAPATTPTLEDIERGLDELFSEPASAADPPRKVKEAKPTPEQRVEDVGENLWYNRRNFTGKALEWAAVKDLNDTLKVKEVVKSKVWPRPNYEQLVADGLQPFFARLLKQVYDGIAPEPQKKTDEDLERYVVAVNKVRSVTFDWIKEKNEDASLRKEIDETLASKTGGATRDIVDALELSLMHTIWPESKYGENARGWQFPHGSEIQKELHAVVAKRKGRYVYHSPDFVHFDWGNLRNVIKDVKAGFPTPQEMWQKRGYRIVKGDSVEPDYYESEKGVHVSFRVKTPEQAYTTSLNWDRSQGQGMRDLSHFVKGAKGKTDAAVQQYVDPILARYHGSRLLVRHSDILGVFKTEKEAKDAAREHAKPTKGEGTRDLRGMNISEAERIGPDRRQANENISAERLMSEFGFRGVNFGREGWINQVERQAYLNAAYDALIDLAEILDVPPKALSLNGMMGIAFGAQGRGGKVAAHFVPGVNEINLTKTKGAGTLAHEWGHALDHYFARMAGFSKAGEPYLTHNIKEAVATMKPRTQTERTIEPDSIDDSRIELKPYKNQYGGRDAQVFVDGQEVGSMGYRGDITHEEAMRIAKKIAANSVVLAGVEIIQPPMRPEIAATFQAISEAMNKRVMSESEVKARRAQRVDRAKESLNSWLSYLRRGIQEHTPPPERPTALEEFDKLAERLRDGDMGEGYIKVGQMVLPQVIGQIRLLIRDKASGAGSDVSSNWKGLEANARHMRSIRSMAEVDKEHIPQETVETIYRKESKAADAEKKGKAYWDTETEKFARAFETFVADELAAISQKNTFLSDAAIRAEMKVGEKYAMPYPRGEERKTINDAFKKLVDTIEHKETEKGTALFARGPDEEERYQKAKVLFDAAMKHFQKPGMSKGDAVRGLVRHLAAKGMAQEKIAAMKPHALRWTQEQPAVAKPEPWQMTQMEVRSHAVSTAPNIFGLKRGPTEGTNTWLPRNFEAHKKSIDDALAAGKLVPKAVLADYKEGRTATKEQEPAVTGAELENGIDLLASGVWTVINRGGKLDNPALRKLADKAFGGTSASGAYSIKDAYDALELGINRHLLSQAPGYLKGEPDKVLTKLRSLMSQLPRQTDRTEEQEAFQQFSTPPTLAYAVAKAADIKPDDIVLEPSAGTGNLSLWGTAGGATVHTNEISPRRKWILENLTGDDPKAGPVTSVDAEILNDVLPQNIQPTVILMNPPFSATGGRKTRNDTKYGARHIEQALLRLRDGGRLVAISGEGMALDKTRFKTWWNAIAERYNVRANLSIPGDEYGKFGTTFGTQLIVIDKTGPTPGANALERMQNITFGTMASIEDALDALQPIIADRSVAQPLADVRVSGGERPESETGRGGELRRPEPRKRPVRTPTTRPGKSPQLVSGGEPGPQAEPGELLPSGGSPVAAVELIDGIPAAEEPDFVPASLGLVQERNADLGKEEVGGTFVEYRPAKLTGGMRHPGDIVETASLAAIEPPDVTYTPHIPKEVIDSGGLSDLQIETVSYIGQRHELFLSNGQRAGYYVGDGTGVGKGRELAAAVLDNWNQKRRRAVWVSVSKDLIEAARDDFEQVGAKHIPLALLNKWDAADTIDLKEGTIFATYPTLISSAKKGNKQKRREQLEKWLGEDGIIIFDEGHKAKNLIAAQGEPTQTGRAVFDIQENLPKARVMYASATGATEVRNMAYMTRLGLWGPGTAFPGGFTEFMNEIDRGGVGAMEMVARDMKALGLFASRMLSYRGVEYREIFHKLDERQRNIYDAAANAMQVILQNIEEALKLTDSSPWARKMAMAAFWGNHQRLFRQIITALKVPTLIEDVDEALASGKSVVIDLVGTGEARTKEKVTQALAAGASLEDLDFSPRETIAQLLDAAFPTELYQDVQDPNDPEKVITQVVRDDDGNVVHSQEALKMKNALLDKLGDLDLPENPLDQIVNYYGEDKVAEITGRRKRLVRKADGSVAYVKRAPEGVSMDKTNLYEMGEFQDGNKRIAIISPAGGTGISLHASRRAKNQQQRVHVILEVGWSADAQLQKNGRTHRSDQAQPPRYDLLSSDVGGERRFSSTIAKRLASLGALTKAERKGAGAGELAKYNFETEEGRAALSMFYNSIMKNSRTAVPGIENAQQALRDMGILKPTGDGGEAIKDDDYTHVPRFLNRILALDLKRQNPFFDQFIRVFDDLVNFRKETGQFDEGVADVKADTIKIKGEPQVVHTDKLTSATTSHYELEVAHALQVMEFPQAQELVKAKFEAGGEPAFYQQRRSGNFILARRVGSDTDAKTGRVISRYRAWTPEKTYIITDEEFAKYDEASAEEARQWWEERAAKAPRYKTSDMHIISGAILPLWQKLKTEKFESLKVVRLFTDDGQRILGVQVPNENVAKILRAIGVSRRLMTPEEIFRAVLEQGDRLELAAGLSLARGSFHGEPAIHLKGTTSYQHEQLREFGLLNEKIDWRWEFYVPSDIGRATPVLEKLLEAYPVIDQKEDVEDESAQFARQAERPAEGQLEVAVDGHRIQMNNAARLLMLDAYRLSPHPYSITPDIRGATERAPRDLIRLLRQVAEQEPERGPDVEQFVSAVQEAAKAGKPIELFTESAKWHERVHGIQFEASQNAPINRQLTPEGFARLAARPEYEQIDRALTRKGERGTRAVRIAEAAAYIADGKTLGLSIDDATEWLADYFDAFAEKNGKISVRKFKELAHDAQGALQNLERAITRAEATGRFAGRGLRGLPAGREEGAEEVPRGSTPEIRGAGELESPTQFGRRAVTDTPEFRRWFGDSTVVDENGEPLVVYHGTDADFDTFEFSEDIGFHFGSLPVASARAAVSEEVIETAADLGIGEHQIGRNIIPAYLKVSNPLRMVDMNDWAPQKVLRELVDLKILTDEEADNVELVDRETVRDLLARKGYDGIVYDNEVEAKGEGGESWIVFDSRQVKSAIGNRGTFNPSNPNILMARSGLEEPEYLGTIAPGGEVIGREDPYGYLDHETVKLHGRHLWRYKPDTHTIYWTDKSVSEVPDDTRFAVEDWLARKRLVVTRHATTEDLYRERSPRPLFARGDEPETLQDIIAELKRLARNVEVEAERPEGMKRRRLPQTFAAAGMEEGTNLYYDPAKIKDDALPLARRLIAEKGVDGAMEWIKTGDGIEWASVGYEVLAILRAEANRIRATTPAEADKIDEKRLEFLNTFNGEATRRGQTVAGINAIEWFAPDRAAYILNKRSLQHRGRGISPEEEARVTEMAEQLSTVNERVKALEENIAYRIEVAKSLEEDLAAAEARARRRESYEPGEAKERKPAKRPQYEVTLDDQAKEAKELLMAKLGNLSFGSLKVTTQFPGQKGAVGYIEELPEDGELLARYAASLLSKLKTVEELDLHLLGTFGREVQPYLSSVRQRAWQIRKDLRTEELASKETTKERRKTILAEIQAEIRDAQKYERDIQQEMIAAAKEQAKRDKQEMKAEARAEAKAAYEAERQRKRELIKEARQQKADAQKEYAEARKAEMSGYRDLFKGQRAAARVAAMWDTPIRNAAAEARTRLADATDPMDQAVMDDLVRVGAEHLLPEITFNKDGSVKAVRSQMRVVNPGQFYSDMKAEFPGLVTKKNQGKIYQRTYQQIRDVYKASQEAAKMRSANAESKVLWDNLGLDVNAQAVLIQRAQLQRERLELRSKMAQEFNRVSQSFTKKAIIETLSLWRALQSSVDAPTGRQGLFLAITHPLETLRGAIPATLKGYAADVARPRDILALIQHPRATWSAKPWKRGEWEELERFFGEHPYFELGHLAGLDLPERITDAMRRIMAEEDFQSAWAAKFPHVRLSEQAFVHGMNIARLNAFARMAALGEAEGYTWETNPIFFRQVSAFINATTGRANMQTLVKQAAVITNFFFYSTRLNLSRAQLFNQLFNPFKYLPSKAEGVRMFGRHIYNPLDSGGGAGQPPPPPGEASDALFDAGGFGGRGLKTFDSYDPVMRKVMLQELLRLAAALFTFLLVARLLGFSVNLSDLDDPDWGKVRWGNTSYDVTGGHAATLRMFLRILRGVAERFTTDPKDIPESHDPWNVFKQFLKFKFGPGASFAYMTLYGEDVVRQPKNFAKFESPSQVMRENIILDMVTPMIFGEFADGIADSGWLGVAKTLPALAGVGVQTYDRSKNREYEAKDLKNQYISEVRALRQSIGPEKFDAIMGKVPRRDLEDTEAYFERRDKEPRQALESLPADKKAEWLALAKKIEESVRSNQLQPGDQEDIVDAAKLTADQLRFQRLDVLKAMDEFEKMSPEKQKDYKEILIKKGSSISGLFADQQPAARARYQKLTGQPPRVRPVRTRDFNVFSNPAPSPTP